jgi:hypothetical protein
MLRMACGVRAGWMLGTALAIAAGAPPARASLLGDTVDLAWYQPTPTALQEDDGTRLVGSGVEYPSALSGLFAVDIGASTMTISHTGAFATEPELGITFFGVTLTDLTQPLVGATIDPSNTLSGLTPGDITVANDQVTVNVAGYLWGVSQVMVVDLAVPEPTGLALLAIPALALMRIRRPRAR